MSADSGRMAHVVREALDAVAAPSTRDEILERALFVAGMDTVPDEGPELREFIDHFLRQAMCSSIGEASAEQVMRDLSPIVAMAKTEEDVSQIRCLTTRPPPEGLDDQIEIEIDLDGVGDDHIALGSSLEDLIAPSPLPVQPPEQPGSIEPSDSDPTDEYHRVESSHSRGTTDMSDPLGFGDGPLELPEPLEDLTPAQGKLREPIAPPISGPYPRDFLSGEQARDPIPQRRDAPGDDEMSGERASHPRILLASRQQSTVDELARALRDVGTLVHAPDAFALLEAFEPTAIPPDVVVVDGRHPSVQPATLAALDPDLPPSATIVVWGAPATLTAQLEAVGATTSQWRMISSEVSVWEIVEVCTSLFEKRRLARVAR